MGKKKNLSEIEHLRFELAGYHGMLARWGDLTRNILPVDVNRTEWQKKVFEKWVNKELTKKRKGKKK